MTVVILTSPLDCLSFYFRGRTHDWQRPGNAYFHVLSQFWNQPGQLAVEKTKNIKQVALVRARAARSSLNERKLTPHRPIDHFAADDSETINRPVWE